MKSNILILIFLLATIVATAQTDMTDQIVNPSFETNDNTGWTWIGADGYAWIGPNDDGDETKDGTYINGLWNNPIGDVECSQTITGLENGTYKVTVLLTLTEARSSNQRLFASSGELTKSVLYASESNFLASNLSVLGQTEEYAFGGLAFSTAENGPFNEVALEIPVSDGSLTMGIRVSGQATELSYDFSASGDDAGFFKFDGFTLTYLGSETAVSDQMRNDDIQIEVINGYISVKGTEEYSIYNMNGRLLPANQQLQNGLYIVKTNNLVKKVRVNN